MTKDAALSRPCLFFDRDGVINVPPPLETPYLRCWSDFQFVSGMEDVLTRVGGLGFIKVLITNQQGVAKGVMTEAELTELHAAMQEHLEKRQAGFDAIQAATGLTARDHRRKPHPTMLLEAAETLNIDLSRSWMIGDHDNDMRAAKAAGVGTIRFVGLKAIDESSDYIVRNAEELLQVIVNLPLYAKQETPCSWD